MQMRCMGCMQILAENATVCPHCGYIVGTDVQNAQYLSPGTVLGGKYTIGKVLGAGGFGVTYIAWDNNLSRRVAIKEYFPGSLSTRMPGQTEITAFTGKQAEIFAHGLKRFQEEAQLLMQFSGYEGIVSIYDVLQENGTAYMVMEYVEGQTLKDKIAQNGPLTEQELLNCMIPMLLSLKFAHNINYIHRDIAPDNIMIQEDGTIKLLDFGAARYSVMEASQSLSVIVKEGYTPIEQYQSHGKQGPWTDIYAVGATMYYALTGLVPREALDRLSADKLKTPQQSGVSVSENTENAIMSALNVRPEERPQDIDAFLEILTGEKSRIKASKSRSPLKIAAFAAAGIAVVAGLVVGGIALFSKKTETPSVTQIDVPSVIRKNVDEASQLLAAQDLGLQVVGGKYFDLEMIENGYIEKDLVMEQTPEAGAYEQTFDLVDVIISKGKEVSYIPPATDVVAESAKHNLIKVGVPEQNIEVLHEYSDENLAGTIISQSVPANEPLPVDTPITLTVSIGPESPEDYEDEEISLSDYTGWNFDEAKEILLDKGLYLVRAEQIYSADHPENTIICQDPESGSILHPGDAVFVVTSLGQERTRVPDVIYQEINDAETVLAECGLSWSIQYVTDSAVSPDHVITQSIEPGDRVPVGTVVDLSVSAVEKEDAWAPTGNIAIAPDDICLTRGETCQLQCITDKTGTIIWATSNPEIAEVDASGLLRAVSFGTTTVTATLDGLVASQIVQVTDGAFQSERNLYTIQAGETISALSDIPESSRDGLKWWSNVPSVANVDQDGLISGISEGYSTVIADNGSQTFSFGITVEPGTRYISLPIAEVLSTQTAAETLLKENEIEYAIKQQIDERIPYGTVIKLEYTGHEDEENYYIEENTPVSLLVSSGKNTVTALRVKTNPKKMSYKAGEKPDYAGMVLEAVYKDGSTTSVTSGYSAPNSALTTVPSQSVTISYGGGSTTLNFNVTSQAKLTVKTAPEKNVYYIGDKPDTTGLVLEYTDDQGKKTSVTSGYQVSGSLDTAGSQTVTVTYKKQTATYQVTVKTPSIEASVITDLDDYPVLSAKTDPANLSVTWSSSDTSVFKIAHSGNYYTIQATGGGTAYAIAKMTYNGKEYTAEVPIKILDHSYSFRIYQAFDSFAFCYDIETEIPGFDINRVSWNASPNYNGYLDESGRYCVRYPESSFTLTATYDYNGQIYSDSLTVQVKEYELRITRTAMGENRYYFSASSDAPNFNPAEVEWSHTTYDLIYGGSLSAYQEGDGYYVDQSGVEPGESYTVYATYRGVTSSYKVSVEW